MNRPKLLIVIDNLKRGGAEVLLVGILEELKEKFEVIVVTITNECQFETNEIVCKSWYKLNSGKRVSFISSILKLKHIIRKYKPDIVHAHLFYSSLIARICCPSKIPLIYSVHNEMSKSLFSGKKVLTLLERETIRKRHTLLAVSQSVLADYKNTIKKISSFYVLRNYISDEYSGEVKKSFKKNDKLRMVAIGNIKDQKNYSYLIEAFRLLKTKNITLDIYGYGNEDKIKVFEEKISCYSLPIFFKGSVSHPSKILPNYDLYISSSKYEGFGIATIEAMAMGLPLLLSDLPVYHEITLDNALFFQIEDPNSFVELINEVSNRKYNLELLSKRGIEVSKVYSKEIYLKNLFAIYEKLLLK